LGLVEKGNRDGPILLSDTPTFLDRVSIQIVDGKTMSSVSFQNIYGLTSYSPRRVERRWQTLRCTAAQKTAKHLPRGVWKQLVLNEMADDPVGSTGLAKKLLRILPHGLDGQYSNLELHLHPTDGQCFRDFVQDVMCDVDPNGFAHHLLGAPRFTKVGGEKKYIN
jgi:hypothetical protein